MIHNTLYSFGRVISSGADAEECAAEYLKKNSFVILQRNYRIPRGEIDIISKKGSLVVFVEVKYLSRGTYYPEEQITLAKQRCLFLAGESYLQRSKYSGECRFDVISISPSKFSAGRYDIYHIEDALESHF